ncbi:MAG: HAD family hydrolase [Thermoguttaceae bacterium]
MKKSKKSTSTNATKNNRPVVAICYDFDGTLCPGNMQEYGFIQKTGKNISEFWKEARELSKQQDVDQILAYMNIMIRKADQSEMKTTREAFRNWGKDVTFFPGVTEWFDRINKFGDSLNLEVEHFIVSSGLTEMIEGTSIATNFKKIYACSFRYDQNGVATWPAQAVNFTTKTQFLFRINKDVLDGDANKINEYVPNEQRRVPFSRMIYIGDGQTDIPCMKLVKDQGGFSIAVYPSHPKNLKDAAAKLLSDGRVNFCSVADYTEKSSLDDIMKAVIKRISAEVEIKNLQKKYNSR